MSLSRREGLNMIRFRISMVLTGMGIRTVHVLQYPEDRCSDISNCWSVRQREKSLHDGGGFRIKQCLSSLTLMPSSVSSL